jgi:hypothetical protein
MGHDTRQLSGNGSVDSLHGAKVGRKEYVEVTLMDLYYGVNWPAVSVCA